ncbi:hypothetical protein Tco_1064522, partial [Tanacetum coccineum]
VAHANRKRKLMRARYKLLKWMCLGDEMRAGLGAEKRAETSGFGCWCGGENGCAGMLKRGLKWGQKWVCLDTEKGDEMDAEIASEISIKDKNGDGDVYKEDDQIPSKGKCLFKALLNRRMSKKDEMLYTYLDEY